MSRINASRRKFLRTASVVSGSVGAAAAPFALNMAALNSAVAQTAGSYKALICMFFYGGNDASHMVLRTDPTSFNVYTTMRNQQPTPINLLAPGTAPNGGATLGTPARLGGVLPITPKLVTTTMGSSANSAFTFAVHPSMTEVVNLFGAGRLAIVANAGPLVQPMTKAQYQANSVPRPRALGSHNDQQSTWQALGPEGVKVGWGGRLGDIVAGGNSNASFTSITVSGNAVFSAGDTVFQYQVGGGGATQIGGISGSLFNSTAAASALRNIVTATITAQAAFQTSFNAATVTAPTTYVQPSTGNSQQNPLAQQLQTVARIIRARSSLGATRQVFFVSMGGFDTHSNQNSGQADLLARISHAIGYFDTVFSNVGGVDMRNDVTLFTASDFGRTHTSNGDGTDHGWGGHHFVLGGAVRGGDIYGRFPQYGRSDGGGGFTSDDQLTDGALLPAISVDQYAATLGAWMGLSDGDLGDVLPHLKNFDASERNLGFMKA